MKLRSFIKSFIILLLLFFPIPPLKSVFASESTEEEQMLKLIENMGSTSELYKVLTPDLPLSELQQKEGEARTRMIKKQMGIDAEREQESLTSTLKIISYWKHKIREIAKQEADMYIRPVKSATPKKSKDKNGAVFISGNNVRVAIWVLKNYFQRYSRKVTNKDIQETIGYIRETKGDVAHKGFTITLGNKTEDKLGNVTEIPLSFSLRGDDHFPDWSFSKEYTPLGGKDADTGKDILVKQVNYKFVKIEEAQGDWWGFNSKETHAFGWASKVYYWIRNENENSLTEISETRESMDVVTREPKVVTKEITGRAADTGEILQHYKEHTEVLEYKTLFDKDGEKYYLPKVVQGERYDDNSTQGVIKTYFREYRHYDKMGRVDCSLRVEMQKNILGRVKGNKLVLYKVNRYDPITHLTPREYGSHITITDLPIGDLITLEKYGESMWKMLASSGFFLASATQVSQKLEAALGNTEKATADNINSQSDDIKRIAQRLLGESSSPEVKKVENQLRELREDYGGKLVLPSL